MIFTKYFFRIDDVAPNMNWDSFYRLAEIFKKYGIKPLLAVIPDVRDRQLLVFPENKDFWSIISQFAEEKWVVGQHGYRHLYNNKSGGILKINKMSEFSGLDFDNQLTLIDLGKNILKSHSIDSKIFIAPAHSFDENTILALKENSFDYISDGIALYPFKKWGIIWLPQVLWHPRKWWFFGMATVALHPNTMIESDFIDLKEFLEKNTKKIGDFSELMNWYSRANIFEKFFSSLINLIFKPFWIIAFKIKHDISK